jgi:hypothetical protein
MATLAKLTCAVGLILLALSLRGLALSYPVDLTPYANANLHDTVSPAFPAGRVVPPMNPFGVPFVIPDHGLNYVIIGGIQWSAPVTIHVGVPSVRKVYTLLQAFGPWEGERICTVEFIGSAGARQTFSLIGGAEIRDFFESSFARHINNTTTRPAYELIGPGGAYTANTATGPRGFYDFDEQEFVLSDAFAAQTLDSIVFDSAKSVVPGTPFLSGLTVVTAEPEPFSFFSRVTLCWVVGALLLAVLLAAGVTALRRWLNNA